MASYEKQLEPRMLFLFQKFTQEKIKSSVTGHNRDTHRKRTTNPRSPSPNTISISVVRMSNAEGHIKMAVELDRLVQVKMENDVEYTTNLALFTNVSNSDELRQLIVRGKIEAALLNACMILDPFHVIVAGHKSLHLFRQGKMKTRTLHSEIIFNLSPSNNITDSFKKFGILDNTKEILVAMVAHGNATEKVSELSKLIKGTLVSMDTLASICDKGKIKKVYGIRENELECDSLENAIISRLATKDAS